MAEHWHDPLPQPIALVSGGSLDTLLEVGAFLRERFGGRRRTPPVEAAISALLLAAETGDAQDSHAAHACLSRLLRFNRLAA